MPLPRLTLLFCALSLIGVLRLPAQTDPRSVHALPEVAFDALSDRSISPMGKKALSIRPADWKHAESQHFIFHALNSALLTPTSLEAEFYYRIITGELNRDSSQWERKSHVFIFEKREDWASFSATASLDPWTGGLNAGNELFIRQSLGAWWSNRTLGHEICHLVVFRFVGNGLPLWLSEGFAEYASIRGYSSYLRARNYRSKPLSSAVPENKFLSLSELTGYLIYPPEPKVDTFYDESEKLVRFLSKTNSPGFLRFFEAMAKGNRFETALSSGYGMRFASVPALEEEFKKYATKDFGTTLQDKSE